MEIEPQIEGIESIGQRLHEAETAIGVGRRAVWELLRQEPVDIEAVSLARQSILVARLERNELIHKLEQARPRPPYRYKW
jgi:hypothetical protein